MRWGEKDGFLRLNYPMKRWMVCRSMKYTGFGLMLVESGCRRMLTNQNLSCSCQEAGLALFQSQAALQVEQGVSEVL